MFFRIIIIFSKNERLFSFEKDNNVLHSEFCTMNPSESVVTQFRFIIWCGPLSICDYNIPAFPCVNEHHFPNIFINHNFPFEQKMGKYDKRSDESLLLFRL